MKIDWRVVEYVHVNQYWNEDGIILGDDIESTGEPGYDVGNIPVGTIQEREIKIENFSKLRFSQAIKGKVKNIGFFVFLITKGCDIRYYKDFKKIKAKNIKNFKNKFLLKIASQVDVLNPENMHQRGHNISLIGSYDNINDAFLNSERIADGFLNSLLSGEKNSNFSKESKRLLIEHKYDHVFMGKIQR